MHHIFAIRFYTIYKVIIYSEHYLQHQDSDGYPLKANLNVCIKIKMICNGTEHYTSIFNYFSQGEGTSKTKVKYN